jgi:hypothetical protein
MKGCENTDQKINISSLAFVAKETHNTNYLTPQLFVLQNKI